MSDITTMRFLDEIEDAEDALQRYKAGLGWAWISLCVFLMSIFLGAGVITGGLSTALVIVGVVGSILSVIFGAIWVFAGQDPHPAVDLREARRNYDRYLIEQAAKDQK